MNRHNAASWLLSLMVASGTLASSLAWGQQSQPVPPLRRRIAPQTRSEAIDNQVKKMAEQFALTADQQSKIKTLYEREQAQALAIRNAPNPALSQGARFMKVRDLRQQLAEDIRNLLTPEQQAKYDKVYIRPKETTKQPAGQDGKAD